MKMKFLSILLMILAMNLFSARGLAAPQDAEQASQVLFNGAGEKH